MLSLLLENAQGFARVLDHPWRQKDIQIGFIGFSGLLFEHPAEQRDITQNRHLVFVLGGRVVDQTADYHGLLVLDDNRGVDRTLQGHRQGRRSCQGLSLIDFGDLQIDLHANQAIFSDVGRNFQGFADIPIFE